MLEGFLGPNYFSIKHVGHRVKGALASIDLLAILVNSVAIGNVLITIYVLLSSIREDCNISI